MKSIVKYILISGLRDKLYLAIFITLFCAISLAIFFASTFLVENQQTALVYIAGSSRIIIVIGLILFVCLGINRAFANKEVEFILAKSISRNQFILSYLVGYLISSALILAPLALLLIFLMANKIGVLIWTLSLFCEIWIAISFAILTSLILQNAFSAILSTLAFYIISRLMGVFVLAINLPQNFAQIKNDLMPTILKIISIAFPRLDLFTQSNWLIYGVENFFVAKIIFFQSIIYIALMLAMSFYDLNKKSF